MSEIKLTRNFFLWCMTVIYLAAFSSLYVQIPGLFGDNGILPARRLISIDANAEIMHKKMKALPTLLWFAPTLGIDISLMMDFLALLGILISFGGMIWGRMRDMINFTLLWMLYFSLFQVGQTFLDYEWDKLLLEAGFITIVIAPFGFLQNPFRSGFLSSLPHKPYDNVSMWLLRWLLFRFMFAFGVLKLSSMSPAWWNLTALQNYFESQNIPSPLAWYAYHLPLWTLKLGAVGTLMLEIILPFLYFAPVRSLRVFCFYTQVFFQFLIIITGNMNFINLLLSVLSLSLIDDDILLRMIGRPPPAIKNVSGTFLPRIKMIISLILQNVIIIAIAYYTTQFFSLQFLKDWTIESKIVFTPTQFRNAIVDIIPITICVGLATLGVNIISSLYKSLNEPGFLRKLYSLFNTLFICCIAMWLFIISLVPHASLDMRTRNDLWPVVKEWHKNIEDFKISNTYGHIKEFMENGRSEIVLEGSYSEVTGWKEYHFLYKLGEFQEHPPFIVPHQPRLDWQMWHAALGNFEDNPWFINFVNQLLEGHKDVINLLDKDRLPFPINKPPKYIRAILYKYSYTTSSSNKKKGQDWWIRRKVREYFNSATNEKQMLEHLENAGFPMEKSRTLLVTNSFLKKSLLNIRSYIGSIQPTTFVWALIGTGFLINFLSPILRL